MTGLERTLMRERDEARAIARGLALTIRPHAAKCAVCTAELARFDDLSWAKERAA